MNPNYVFAGFVFIGVTGCDVIGVAGNGHPVTDTRDESAFSAVVADTSLDVVITRGDVASVVVITDGNLVPFILTDVIDGTLHITDTRNVAPRTPSVVNVVVPALDAASADGSGSMNVSGFDGASLQLENGGSGDLVASVRPSDLVVSANGSGDVKLDGAASNVVVDLGGSGSVSLGLDGTSSSKLGVSGSGSIHARLDAGTTWLTISGSGSIHWTGDATLAGSSDTGSGSIVHD